MPKLRKCLKCSKMPKVPKIKEFYLIEINCSTRSPKFNSSIPEFLNPSALFHFFLKFRIPHSQFRIPKSLNQFFCLLIFLNPKSEI